MSKFSLAIAICLLAACGRSPTPAAETSPPTFSYAMLDEATLSASVSAEDGALAGAVVVVRAPSAPIGDNATPDPTIIWQGGTDAEGRVTARFSRRSQDEALEVLVSMPGYVGEYADEAKRSAFGPFAPAAWLDVMADDVIDLHIELQQEEEL